MSDTDAGDLLAPPPRPKTGVRWKAVVGLLGVVGLTIATASTVDDIKGRALPGWGPVVAALVLQTAAMVVAARAWVSLFPPRADRAALASALYTSQLTKYLPAGGFVQAASQVALSSHEGSMVAAALRLPVFSLSTVVAAFSLGSTLMFNTSLPAWGRVLAGCGILTVALLDRRMLASALRAARRVVHRLPAPDNLPPQRAILRCYGLMLVSLVATSAGFALMLRDVADVNLVFAGAAFCAGWAGGYLALPIPSGLFVREAVLIGALPSLATGTLLAASVAQRIVGFVAEALLAGVSYLRAVVARRTVSKRATDDVAVPDGARSYDMYDPPHHG